MFLRSSIRQFAAYIALLSVAMLFIAPLVSKSIVQMNDCITDNGMMHNMQMADHSIHMHEGSITPESCEHGAMVNHFLMSSVGQSPAEDIACGYCQLLIHFPFLILFIAVLIRQLATLTLFIPFARSIQLWVFRPWSLRFARAPPVHYFL